MKSRKYVLYGIFVLCFTKVYYILLDGIVRDDEEFSVPSYIFKKRNIFNSRLNGSAPVYKRPESVADICKSLEVGAVNNQTQSVLSVYHFYDRSKICSCHVPKAASTSIGRALLISEFPEKAVIFRNLPGYQLHALREVQNVTSNQCFTNAVTSFLVTRDPYRRLFSAYIDKIYLEKFHKLSVVLDALYNKGVSREKLKDMIENKDERLKAWYCSVTDVSFEQFLKYVTTTQSLDTHFAPVSHLCDPCTKHYDVILKQETLTDDMHYLFEKIYKRNYSAREIPDVTDYTGESGIESQILTYFTHRRAWFSKHNCKIDRKTYNAINQRLWNGLKLLGSIDDNLEFIDELFKGPVGERLRIRNPETVLYEFKLNRIPYLKTDSREKQRRKHLIQAYQSVDISVIKRIQQLFQLDFTLFGYDPLPPTLY
ncbi:carbohydrate sulfotransferase 10-like [Mercenaria mercenaria]|uniref:carbohydrate sulfotransferase 10-like n=1 Tax=Mercenaria mercenaria TaxID=6596 RepID=UPI00234E4CEF|nr:carbohydrate sulfotransferase 10-like [Mercenaria mercenaria]